MRVGRSAARAIIAWGMTDTYPLSSIRDRGHSSTYGASSLPVIAGEVIATDGRSRRLPAPVKGDDTTISGDGWTLKAAAGWVSREGARRGYYEVVRRQP